MIKIETLIKDIIVGKFKVSDYGLKVGSFSYTGESEDDIGMGISTIEEFIGHNPVPVYLGQKYTDKLRLQITLVKNPSLLDIYFTEKDCRWVLRTLTGIKGYQWVKLIAYELDEDLWYRARINSVSYERIGGHITGIVLNMECDSCFAWSKEFNITINAIYHDQFYIFIYTVDFNNYV